MKVTCLAAPAVGFALLFAGPASAHSGGALYTQSNAATGNAVHRVDRGPDGALTPVATYRTGGRGSGAGLGSQGAVALSDDGRVLVAVDAGSNDVAAFRVTGDGHLTRTDRKPSGGVTPVSADVADGSVYVLNAGGDAPNVAAFDVDRAGRLHARAVRALAPGAAGAAQVSVAPDGRSLVVTEKQSNRLETLALRHGRLGAPVVTASAGAVPFGFAFSPRGDLIVSEAGASTVSSYRGGRVITAALPVGQGAACWVAIDPSGRFAYTGNASGSISGFAIHRDGSLRALDADGLTAVSPQPNDLAFAGGYLYAINPASGSITAYRQRADGALTPLAGASDLGAGLAGLAAR
ncbi:MAG TPA: beta-propeller fold lactonase family protein [Solirubrobacter sp.]|nr:beta-propeller fold lactonase family protein [Solirubrobacter sp.]